MNQPVLDEHDTLPPSMDPAVSDTVQEPPTDFIGILKKLGPGLIIAGSIVGSGELIATTKTGAQAGISLLWLIIIGCLIKVFVQIELGRFTLTHGETTLAALDQVPGPRLKVNWIIWFWFLMMLVSLGQLGGIVGGVGQALAISFPLTGDYASAIQIPSTNELKEFLEFEKGGEKFARMSEIDLARKRRGHEEVRSKLLELDRKGEHGTLALKEVEQLVAAERALEAAKAEAGSGSASDHTLLAAAQQQLDKQKQQVNRLLDPRTWDDLYWATAITLATIALLYRGSYGIIQDLSTVMVVAFTFITVGNVIALQNTQQWSISLAEFAHGLSFHAPPGDTPWKAWKTALATFGIIGVGASELVAYPYWCLEKGYAKFTGPRSDDESWARRARGWMRVMHYDAWASMLIYTTATLAFFLMGVAVLYREGRDPDGMRMVSTLSTAYVPIFGDYARILFLVGAFAVLYSTFLVANAGHARTFTDSFKLLGLLPHNNQKVHNRSVSWLGVVLPLICLGLFATRANPVTMVLLGGTMQAIMLPMLGFAALYFRRTRTDPRLEPGRLWDVLLAVSCLGLLIAGGWEACNKFGEISKLVMGLWNR